MKYFRLSIAVLVSIFVVFASLTPVQAEYATSKIAVVTPLKAPRISLGNSSFVIGIAKSAPRNTVKSLGGKVDKYSIAPNLPSGLNFSSGKGTFSGKPRIALKKTRFTITATNASGSSRKSFFLEVVSKPSITLSGASKIITPGVRASLYKVKNKGGRIFNFSIAPQLPAGLVLNTKTGLITGVPSQPKARTAYTIKAMNPAGTSSKVYSLEVLAPPLFTLSSALLLGVNTNVENFSLNSTGGLATWSVTPALPNGLTLNSATGQIIGSASGPLASRNYSLTATNAAGTLNKNFSLEVLLAPSFTINSHSESVVAGHSIFGFSTSNTGGRVTSWSVAPSLPEGLSLNSATGEISGSPVHGQAPVEYLVSATNIAGTVSQAFTLEVIAPPQFTLSAILENLALGSEVSGYAVHNTEGAPTSYSISQNAPNWLSFDTLTGLISGIADAVSELITLTITGSNQAGSYSESFQLRVLSAPAFSLSKISEETALGDPISTYSINSTGGTITEYSISPTLPSGLVFDSLTGLISGAADSAHSATLYTISGSNVAGSVSRTFTLSVVTAPAFTLSSTSENLVVTSALAGYELQSTGGEVSSYAISPAPPVGISFDSSTGLLSGVSLAAHSATTYTVSTSNAAGSASATFTLEVFATPAFALSRASNEIAVGSATAGYSITTTGGRVTVYTISPTPAAGLNFDSSTGLLSGTPEGVLSPTAYTISGTNVAGSASATFTLSVVSAPSLTLTTTALIIAKGTLFAGFDIESTGGVVSTYSISPALPAGLSLNSSSGVISGSPTAPQAAVTYTISATNVAGVASKTFTLEISNPPVFSISTSTLVLYLQDVIASSYTISSTGGTVSSYSVSPSFPAGISFNSSTGLISGTPTEAVTPTDFTITATNPAGSVSRTLNLEVKRSCATGGVCVLGDTGPGGGRVSYVSLAGFTCGLTMADTCHYLEVAPNTWFGGVEDPGASNRGSAGNASGSTGIIAPLVDSTATSLGRGRYNTSLLIQWGGAYSPSNIYAAGMCAAYSKTYKGNTLQDWFQPTQGELSAVASQTGIYSYLGGGNKYWTSDANPSYFGSTSWDTTWASGLNGGTGSSSKPSGTNYKVRPVRAW